jgi:uncharacterized protein YwgA
MASEVTQTQIDALERVLDRVFKEVGIDVEFSRHFVDRVNDERNKKQITVQELALLFKKEFIRWGKQIAQLGPDSQAVMKDLESDINIPFALDWNGSELELVAKTVMRKAGFKTSNQEFPVESTDLREMAQGFVSSLRKRAEQLSEDMTAKEIDDFHTELDTLVHKHLGHSSDEHVEEAEVEMCSDECCGQPVTDCTCGPDCEHCEPINK